MRSINAAGRGEEIEARGAAEADLPHLAASVDEVASRAGSRSRAAPTIAIRRRVIRSPDRRSPDHPITRSRSSNQLFRNRLQLEIRRALVYLSNLRVAPQLLDR